MSPWGNGRRERPLLFPLSFQMKRLKRNFNSIIMGGIFRRAFHDSAVPAASCANRDNAAHSVLRSAEYSSAEHAELADLISTYLRR